MLVLSRKIGDRVLIGGSIVVTVVALRGGTVRLGFDAPAAIDILREEISTHGLPMPNGQEKESSGSGFTCNDKG